MNTDQEIRVKTPQSLVQLINGAIAGKHAASAGKLMGRGLAKLDFTKAKLPNAELPLTGNAAEKNLDTEVKGPRTHNFPDNILHYEWNNALAPVLTINPGDTVVYDFCVGGEKQIHPKSTLEDWVNFDLGKAWPLSGPVYINGAQPGDVLEIEILDLRTKGWGLTGVLPGLGLLPEEFDQFYLRIFEFKNEDYLVFNDNIHIPLRPFLGVMGVAPAQPGAISCAAPSSAYGGNMDIKHLGKGARLFLPVQVPGALFSAGDGHAAQGDGELCLTAVEAPLSGSLRFNLHKNKTIGSPQFITPPGSLTAPYESKGYFVTTGIDTDLLECAKKATREMISYLETEHKLSRYDAYVLCSIVVDLKISEIVDGNLAVSAYLPLSIFVKEVP